MMKKVVGRWSLVVGILFLLTAYSLQLTACFAQPISSTELIKNAQQYDGKTVVYLGEAIGEVMVRGDFAWVNLNDGKNAIGIWMSKDLAKNIQYTGSYKARGDWLEVTGVFQRACMQHGGGLDIHAQLMRKINPGRVLTEHLNLSKRNFALILQGVLCLVLILRQFKKILPQK